MLSWNDFQPDFFLLQNKKKHSANSGLLGSLGANPVLGSRVHVHAAALSYNAMPEGKNKVSLQGYLRKVYSI